MNYKKHTAVNHNAPDFEQLPGDGGLQLDEALDCFDFLNEIDTKTAKAPINTVLEEKIALFLNQPKPLFEDGFIGLLHNLDTLIQEDPLGLITEFKTKPASTITTLQKALKEAMSFGVTNPNIQDRVYVILMTVKSVNDGGYLSELFEDPNVSPIPMLKEGPPTDAEYGKRGKASRTFLHPDNSTYIHVQVHEDGPLTRQQRGSGGYSRIRTVHRNEEEQTGEKAKEYAAKKLELRKNPLAHLQTYKEFRIAQAVSPHLPKSLKTVACYRYPGKKHDAIIAMQPAKTSLLTLRNPKTPEETQKVLTLMKQQAEILAALHALKIIHNDFKLENVLVVLGLKSPYSVLSDFGCTKTLQEHFEPGEQLGTTFSPPEGRTTAESNAADDKTKSDVWSFGYNLMRLFLENSELPTEDQVHEWVEKQDDKWFIILGKIRESSNYELSDLIDTTLSHDPGDRPSMAEVVANPVWAF